MKDGGFSGLNKSVYDITQETIWISTNVIINDNNKNIIYESYTLDGKFLGRTVDDSTGRFTGSGSTVDDNPDFIDQVRLHGAGKYKIKAIVEATGEEFTRILTIK